MRHRRRKGWYLTVALVTIASALVPAPPLALPAQAVSAPAPTLIEVPDTALWSAELPPIIGAQPAPPPAPEREESLTERTSRSTGRGSAVVDLAATFQGAPYVYGTNGPDTFDCSGLVQYVYREALQVDLPHSSQGIRDSAALQITQNPQPGDLIWTPGHVAIYAGPGQMIDANHPGGSVQFRAMWQEDPTYLTVY